MPKDDHTLTPNMLLRAYAAGVFPMSDHRDDPDIFWVDPDLRGILPLDGFHMSRSLRRTIVNTSLEARFNTDFGAVVSGCADRPDTWISQRIFDLYIALFDMGFAHSQEIWDGQTLVGGVYGVGLGAAFFGESMFSTRTDASKMALAFLVDRLNLTGFRLFDTQFLTPHLASLGGREISRSDYHAMLEAALRQPADIMALAAPQTAYDVVQRNTQTS